MNYSFPRNYINTVISFSLMLSILSGCSIFGNGIFGNGQKAESLSLNAPLESWPDSWNIEQIDREPYLYRIRIKEDMDEHSPAYSVLLKECGVGKNASANATTRQLLVGLKDISIKREEDFLYGEKRIFYKQSSATLDDHNIELSTFTLREDNCVYDTVIWSDDTQPGSVMDWLSNAEVVSLKKIYFAFSHT